MSGFRCMLASYYSNNIGLYNPEQAKQSYPQKVENFTRKKFDQTLQDLGIIKICYQLQIVKHCIKHNTYIFADRGEIIS